MRRLLLLSFIFIITVSRYSYCADHVENPVSKGMLIAKLSVKNYIKFSVGYNLQYWLFGLYQEKPGPYLGRFYDGHDYSITDFILIFIITRYCL